MAWRMRSITFQRIQVFCAVYERQSISAAARALGLSQPTVSRLLRDFEAVSGLSLFVLERGRVVPTPEADTIYAESRGLQDEIGRLTNRIEGLREGAGMKLSIMSIGLLMPEFVPQAIARLMAEMPHLRLFLDVGTAARQLDSIRSGQVDLGIMAGRVAVQEEQIERLGYGRLMALVPRSCALAQAPLATLEQITALPAVDTTARGPIGRILDDALRARGLTVQGQIMCNSLVAVPYTAQALGRAAIVDEFTARAHPQPGLVCVPLEPSLRFEIVAIAPATAGGRAARQVLVTSLRRQLTEAQGQKSQSSSSVATALPIT